MKSLSRITEMVTPSPIRDMYNRSLSMQDVISFTVGEPDFKTPDHIVEAAVEALRRGEHHYTHNAGILPLRMAISQNIRSSHGLTYQPESQVMVTVGCMEALMLAMLTILDPGDEVILSDPCWTNYSRQILICNARPKFITVKAEDNFQFEPTALEAAVSSRTKAFVINSPSNPTGSITGVETLMNLADIAIRHDLYVISDEVYMNLTYENNKAFSIAALPGMSERTIIMNSFSKTYAMTGWRVGFALGPAEIIGNMVKLQENVAACVNTAAQYAAIAALEGPQESLQEMRRIYQQRREIVVDGFSKITGLTCYAPQGAFYVLLDISKTGMRARELALDLLDKEHVVVAPGDAFGKTSDRYLRLSFATSEENIREGIFRIERYEEKIAGNAGE